MSNIQSGLGMDLALMGFEADGKKVLGLHQNFRISYYCTGCVCVCVCVWSERTVIQREGWTESVELKRFLHWLNK